MKIILLLVYRPVSDCYKSAKLPTAFHLHAVRTFDFLSRMDIGVLFFISYFSSRFIMFHIIHPIYCTVNLYFYYFFLARSKALIFGCRPSDRLASEL